MQKIARRGHPHGQLAGKHSVTTRRAIWLIERVLPVLADGEGGGLSGMRLGRGGKGTREAAREMQQMEKERARLTAPTTTQMPASDWLLAARGLDSDERRRLRDELGRRRETSKACLGT